MKTKRESYKGANAANKKAREAAAAKRSLKKTETLVAQMAVIAESSKFYGGKPVPPAVLLAGTGGWCPAGKHALDVAGQACEVCEREETTRLLAQKCPHGVAVRIESCDACDEAAAIIKASEVEPLMCAPLSVDEAEAVRTALVEARHLLELVSIPLMGGGCGARHPVTLVEYALTKAEALVSNSMRLPKPVAPPSK
jgi:hypothetical protein